MNWPFFRLNDEHFTFHLQYKHSGTFANRKYEEQKMREPILVTLLKIRPHYSQSTRENATPYTECKYGGPLGRPGTSSMEARPVSMSVAAFP